MLSASQSEAINEISARLLVIVVVASEHRGRKEPQTQPRKRHSESNFIKLHRPTCCGMLYLKKRRLKQVQISHQPLHTTFPAETAFFVASEWAGGVELIIGVGPNHPGTELVDHLENLAALVRPD